MYVVYNELVSDQYLVVPDAQSSMLEEEIRIKTSLAWW